MCAVCTDCPDPIIPEVPPGRDRRSRPGNLTHRPSIGSPKVSFEAQLFLENRLRRLLVDVGRGSRQFIFATPRTKVREGRVENSVGGLSHERGLLVHVCELFCESKRRLACPSGDFVNVR